jgi:hypothetical protein
VKNAISFTALSLLTCLLVSTPTSAQAPPRLTNGTTADAESVMAHIDYLQQQITESVSSLSTGGRCPPGEHITGFSGSGTLLCSGDLNVNAGNCLTLSSLGDGVLVGSKENQFGLSTQTSIAAWFRVKGACTDVFERCEIISFEQTNSSTSSYNAGISIAISVLERGGTELFSRLIFDATDGRGDKAIPIPTDDWVHILAVRDINQLRFYLNGKLVAESADNPSLALNFDGGDWNHSKTYIGKAFPNGLSNNSVQSVFMGDLSRVGVWSIALTDEQAFNLWAGTFDYLASPPVGFWPLDETRGSIARDISGFGNHGVLEGNASWRQNCF